MHDSPSLRPDRRQVLRTLSALGIAPLALAHAPRFEARQEEKAKPLSILVLGGTGFLGPAVVDAAKARGHQVTLFNRGRTRPQLFPDATKLVGDRDPKKGEGLKALEGKKFDAVIDNSGYYPRHVQASAELLAPHIGHYLYVSSISAYADTKTPNMAEEAPVATMPDPTLEEMGPNYEYYGSLKALCEAAAEKACPGKTTVVRPGYIVGPLDPTDRFTYWPVRAQDGGEFLVPGDGTDPIQVIDVRDLGTWMVHLLEQKTMGIFNACGPAEPVPMKGVIEACVAAAGKDAKPVYVPLEFLREQGCNLDAEFPIFAPGSGDTAGFHRVSNAKAIKAGLTFRSITDITKDTLAYWNTLPEARRKTRRAGLPPEREKAYLTAFAAKK